MKSAQYKPAESMETYPGLTRVQSYGLSLLMQGLSPEEVSKQAGVTVRTIHNWKKRPEFKAYFQCEVRARLFDADTDLLLQVINMQHELRKLIMSDNTEDKLKLEGIKVYLGYATQVRKYADDKWPDAEPMTVEYDNEDLANGLLEMIEAKRSEIREVETVQ